MSDDLKSKSEILSSSCIQSRCEKIDGIYLYIAQDVLKKDLKKEKRVRHWYWIGLAFRDNIQWIVEDIVDIFARFSFRARRRFRFGTGRCVIENII